MTEALTHLLVTIMCGCLHHRLISSVLQSACCLPSCTYLLLCFQDCFIAQQMCCL